MQVQEQVTSAGVRLPSLLQVVGSLGLFLAVACLCTTQLGLPIQLVLLLAWFLIIGLGIWLGHNYRVLEKAAITGISKGIQAVFVLLSVGLLVGTWIAAGIVPTIIYYGLSLIHPSIFLLAALLICSMTSLATGTSWGAVATAGIAMMGIGQSLGVPAPLVAGAVLSGAYFGDKLSPLSDSVVLAASMAEVDVVTHIKGMLPISLVAYGITAVLFTGVGFQYAGNAELEQINQVMNALEDHYAISPVAFIPVATVLLLLSRGFNAFPVISFGALLGMIWAVCCQDVATIDAVMAAYQPKSVETGVAFVNRLLNQGGMVSMLDSVAVILLGLGFGGLIEKIGILDVITTHLSAHVRHQGSVTLSTLIVAFFVNLFGAAMYVALILTPKVMVKHYDRLKLPRKMLSRNAEFGGTLTSGMVPWSDNGLFMASVLGVATLEYAPYMWLSFVCILLTILTAYRRPSA